MVYDGHAKTKSAVPFFKLPILIKGGMSRLCLYSECSMRQYGPG